MYFASDNSGPVAPQVMAALNKANEGYAMPYGSDEIMGRVRTQIRQIFEAPEAEVFLVATGTAANSLALSTYADPWSAIYCHEVSHIDNDECGAPEFYSGGGKLVPLGGDNAKIDPGMFDDRLAKDLGKDVHRSQPGILSITQTNEMGSIYTLEEIRTLTGIAKKHGIPCHMDGARFTNAFVSLSCTAAEMTWKSGIDILSFGGTKNGLMGVEAVVLFDPARAWEFELRRKRGAHLFSKHRFLSAQMEAYLTDDLWLDLAGKANAACARLENGLGSVPNSEILNTPEANIIFAAWPRSGHKRAHEAGAKYYLLPFGTSLEGPDDEVLQARLVCNWATTDADVDRFVAAIKG